MDLYIPDLSKYEPPNRGFWTREESIQTLAPQIGFGQSLPIHASDTIFYHAVYTGDVLGALVRTHGGTWLVGDAFEENIEKSIRKLTDPEYRQKELVRRWHLNKGMNYFRYAGKKPSLEEYANDVATILASEQTKTYSVIPVAGDSRSLNFPEASVDLAFVYEPIFYKNLPAIIEMLAESRKGAIFAFSELNYTSLPSDNLEHGISSVLYKTAQLYGLSIEILSEKVETFGQGNVKVDFVILKGDMADVINSRKILHYLSGPGNMNKITGALNLPLVEVQSNLIRISQICNENCWQYI